MALRPAVPRTPPPAPPEETAAQDWQPTRALGRALLLIGLLLVAAALFGR
ncbi:MAG: DUF58 domain-containing protein, partial [Hamadaea sp.]|nr:DUF58 domain-containing protein [Hamadaea sp.]